MRKGSIVAICGMLFAIGIPMRGQETRQAPEAISLGGVHITGLPDDWTHHHLVFSNPGTEESAVLNGTHEHWVKTVNDPRYIIQQLKRRAPAQGPLAADVARIELAPPEETATTSKSMLWQPLRESWKLNKEKSRAAPIRVLQFLQIAIVTLGLSFGAAFLWRRRWSSTLMVALSTAVFLILTSCGGASTSTSDPPGTPAGETTSGGSNTPSSDSGGAASGQTMPSDWSMDLGNGTVGAGQYPAKYSFSTTATGLCSNSATPDYVVYNTGVAGASGAHANIAAYDNIYTGCAGTVPTVYWSYYTGTGTVSTSPVLSVDGTAVAFIESNGNTLNSTLRILKWVGGQGSDYDHPLAPQKSYTNTYAGANGNTAWSSCPSGQSCMISVAFQTEQNTDTASAPWYDYASDTLYVGDSGGYLHQFTGVFFGTPGESTNHNGGTCGTGCVWPVEVSHEPLTSPVFDNSNSLIFVGISSGEGELASVSTAAGTAGTVKTSNQIGENNVDIADAPLVDPAAGTAGEVYAFVSDGRNGDSDVFQFAEGSISRASGAEETVGTGSDDAVPLYSGTFDNEYFTSSEPSPTGNLWVCGNTGGKPTLYAVRIIGNAMNAATAGPDVSNADTTCSPVTEFCTTSSGTACSTGKDTSGTTQHDYIFVSPQTQSGHAIQSCTADEGCVLSYTIATTPAATYSGSGPFSGGASGMIVDTQNTTVSGTLQLYFGILGSQNCTGNGSAGSGTGGCAIQASQTNP